MNIEIFCSKINKVEHTKFLGLSLDANLSWENHVQALKNKISSGLVILRTMSKFCPTETIQKMIKYAHIHSHILFGFVKYEVHEYCLE